MGGGGTPLPAAPSRQRATKAQRLGDGVALALLVGGVALFFYARHRLQLLAENQITRVEGHWAVEQFMHYYRLSRAGLWIAGAGLLLAVGLALWQRRRHSKTLPRS